MAATSVLMRIILALLFTLFGFSSAGPVAGKLILVVRHADADSWQVQWRHRGCLLMVVPFRLEACSASSSQLA